ncbi:hypothetical protein ABIA31_002406 [Catenulispora sp. MAP5-51]|uniref:hypothetical protein n=1 Tax=Catenulispora sp. MAP5-51 TaxID=3156298 RepID=UPI003512145E
MPKEIRQEFPSPENGFAPARRDEDREGERDRDRERDPADAPQGQPGWVRRLRQRRMSALVAWSSSVMLATVAIALTMAWVHPDKGQWKEFFRGVTGDVAGALLVAFFLSPVFLAIRAFANEKFGSIAEYAPMTGYERFPYLKFIERLERCDDLVRIMDTSSNVLDDTTAEGDEADERLRCVAALRHVLAADNEVRVEILLLDPTADAARQRSADLRGIDVSAGVARNLALLNRIRNDLPEGARNKLLVKLYNATPACAYYRVDDRAAIAFYSLRTASEQSAHVDVALKEKLGKIVNDHFRDIREDADTVEMVDYLYGTLSVGRRTEHVAWVEYGGALFLGLASPRENPVAWTVAPRVGGGEPLQLAAYKHEPAEFRAMRLLPWAECGPIGHSIEEKYGIGFQVLFEVAPVGEMPPGFLPNQATQMSDRPAAEL